MNGAHVKMASISRPQVPPSHSELGAIYTPSVVAAWVAAELIRQLDCEIPVILDPACGDGELLAAVAKAARGSVRLFGWDIDPKAVWKARQRLDTEASLEVADSLTPFDLFRYRRLVPNGVIANPPWGSPVRHSRSALRAGGYELAMGQFDIFELFIERLVKVYPENCVMAFILPDSILLPEHERTRRLLVSSSRLLEIARLGEGFFPGVYRGTVVVFLRTGKPGPDVQVKCSRLGTESRRAVFTGQANLADVLESTSYWVPQAQFLRNEHSEFDLDVRPADTAIASMLTKPRLDWHHWLHIGRGIEIGKRGETLRCPECGWHRPIPVRVVNLITCVGCGNQFPLTLFERVTIIRPRDANVSSNNWHSLIVGEDVRRFHCQASREIQVDAPGIRYKGALRAAGPKLLIRKTGIGLHASIDDTGALTVQTVFHFIPQDQTPNFLLDYLAGVLNSRVMLAFYLRRSGENEWRSHPYVTPKTLVSLPVPDPFADESTRRQAQAIAAVVARLRTEDKPVAELDLTIEGLVAGLYGLGFEECGWVRSVLHHAQPLRAIAALRLLDGVSISPVKVEVS